MPQPHRRRRFTGRDPEEHDRASTPLELLYDLTIVVAYGTAADQLAEYVSQGRAATGIVGFVLAAFAVSWAWLNYSWFASAYDTDDWYFRLVTMVQMIGVIVLSLGLAQLFASLEHGHSLDIGVMVGGYVVMRIGLVALWAQVARQDPERAPAARSYIVTVSVAQVGWLALAVVGPSVGVAVAAFVVLAGFELLGPYLAERKAPTPWNPSHIVERYGLLVIITLGEVIIGTVAALNALVHGEAGWSVDAGLLAFAGVGLTLGCWWMYFSVPWVEPVVRHRQRGFMLGPFLFGYGHLVVFAALAAIGAGLHVAAISVEHGAQIGAPATVLSVAIPIAIYVGAFYALYSLLMHHRDRFHLGLLAATAAVLVLAVVLAAVGVSVAVCLVVMVLAPATTVVGYEVTGHRHITEALERL